MAGHPHGMPGITAIAHALWRIRHAAVRVQLPLASGCLAPVQRRERENKTEKYSCNEPHDASVGVSWGKHNGCGSRKLTVSSADETSALT